MIEKRFVSSKERDKLAGKGDAMPDGSFPMKTRQDVMNARRAIGRTNPSKRGAVKALINSREKALGMSKREDPFEISKDVRTGLSMAEYHVSEARGQLFGHPGKGTKSSKKVVDAWNNKWIKRNPGFRAHVAADALRNRSFNKPGLRGVKFAKNDPFELSKGKCPDCGKMHAKGKCPMSKAMNLQRNMVLQRVSNLKVSKVPTAPKQAAPVTAAQQALKPKLPKVPMAKSAFFEEVSKKKVKDKNFIARPPAFNSRKQNAAAGAITGGATVGALFGGLGAASARGEGRIRRGNVTFLKPTKLARTKAGLATGGVYGALGAATGAATGAIAPHKGSKHSQAARTYAEGLNTNKENYKRARNAARAKRKAANQNTRAKFYHSYYGD